MDEDDAVAGPGAGRRDRLHAAQFQLRRHARRRPAVRHGPGAVRRRGYRGKGGPGGCGGSAR
jgi:hypothetical protein